jgi:hypothetical protein
MSDSKVSACAAAAAAVEFGCLETVAAARTTAGCADEIEGVDSIAILSCSQHQIAFERSHLTLKLSNETSDLDQCHRSSENAPMWNSKLNNKTGCKNAP